MELLSGTILYDKVDKSFGVLIRKYESHNVQEQEWVAYEKAFPEISFHYYENNVWESVWSKDGRVYYSICQTCITHAMNLICIPEI